MWLNRQLATNYIFSMIFDKNDKFDTRQKCLNMSGFSDSLFRSGCTRADFIDAGKIPLVREAFTMSVMIGSNSGRI